MAVASETILAEADGKCRRWHSLGEIHDHLPFASQAITQHVLCEKQTQFLLNLLFRTQTGINKI